MSKVAINNEIILMRKDVIQAKVHVVKKLTRDAFKLRQKKGTDAQKAKNLRKAERLAAEILALKQIKKDEITKYALTNTTTLKEVLEDQKSTPTTRIIARIADHKKFKQRILEFKTKFPNYLEFLGPGRKKKAKIERKEKKKAKINKINNTSNVDTEKSSKELHEDSDESSNAETATEDDEVSNNIKSVNEDENKKENKSTNVKEDSNTNINGKKLSQEISNKNTVKQKSSKKKTKITSNNQAIDETNIKKPDENITTSEKNKNNTSKVISKEAIVKKFTDILKDEDTEISKSNQDINDNFNQSNTNVGKEIDPFFVTENGETNYLSVVPQKSHLIDTEKNHNNKNFNNSHKRKLSQPNDYNSFDKNPRFRDNNSFDKNPRFRDNNFKFNSNKSDGKWRNQQRNEQGRFNDRENKEYKTNSNKFHNENRYKSEASKKQGIVNVKNKNTEILHPSWEAKKKEQEALKKGFQGKKIVFNDDM